MLLTVFGNGNWNAKRGASRAHGISVFFNDKVTCAFLCVISDLGGDAGRSISGFVGVRTPVRVQQLALIIIHDIVDWSSFFG